MTTAGKSPTGICLEDDYKNWFSAEANIKGKIVALHSSRLSNPKFLRYAFIAMPKVSLVNEMDLPA